ncbi:hypothetical protein [Streptomyces sp. NBC_00391]|uniref:hypothetical protein n=1 Tax=Streptomyces sp. NBC_00391 TaxID=2903647 RepID=UPI002E1D4210
MTSPPSADGAGQPVSGTRAEAVARERERLRALKERRDAQSADAGVDGFTVRRWRKVGVFGAQAVLQAHALIPPSPGPLPEFRYHRPHEE